MSETFWSKIKGHPTTIDLLRAVAASGRTSHAYLFCGPRGVGKAMVAQAFAAGLNCPDACGSCRSCRAILARTHPDYYFVEPEGSQYILRDQIVDLLRAVNRKKSVGKYVTAVIDDAHLLNHEAANALLKTLEEPPTDVVFILVAPSADNLLKTISSRCQKVVFSALGTETVREILVENCGVDPVQARLAAKLSRGMVGEAIELVASGLLGERTALIEALLGKSDLGELNAFATKLIAMAKSRSAATKKTHETELAEVKSLTGGKNLSSGVERRLAARHKRELTRLEQRFYRQILALTASVYRDLLLIIGNADKRFIANADLLDGMTVPGVDLEEVKRALAQIELAGRRLNQNVGPQLALENLFFALGAA